MDQHLEEWNYQFIEVEKTGFGSRFLLLVPPVTSQLLYKRKVRSFTLVTTCQLETKHMLNVKLKKKKSSKILVEISYHKCAEMKSLLFFKASCTYVIFSCSLIQYVLVQHYGITKHNVNLLVSYGFQKIPKFCFRNNKYFYTVFPSK